MVSSGHLFEANSFSFLSNTSAASLLAMDDNYFGEITLVKDSSNATVPCTRLKRRG